MNFSEILRAAKKEIAIFFWIAKCPWLWLAGYFTSEWTGARGRSTLRQSKRFVSDVLHYEVPDELNRTTVRVLCKFKESVVVLDVLRCLVYLYFLDIVWGNRLRNTDQSVRSVQLHVPWLQNNTGTVSFQINISCLPMSSVGVIIKLCCTCYGAWFHWSVTWQCAK